MNYKHEPPAFPYTPGDEESGMTLRDYFAAQVVASIAVGRGTTPEQAMLAMARTAYMVADAMLKARGEPV